MDDNKKAMLECITGRLGNITKAAIDANISRSTHYLWMETDPEYKAAVEDVTEQLIDHVEDKLIEKINGISIAKGFDDDGNPIVYDVPPSDTAIIFFLKTRAKKRGYIEKNEVDMTGNVTVKQITGMEVK